MNYGIIFNDGNLDIKDFREECQKEKWLPLTVLRKRDEGTTHVPVFNNSNTEYDIDVEVIEIAEEPDLNSYSKADI